MRINENPFEDILMMDKRRKLLQEQLETVENHAINVDKRKNKFLIHLKTLEENSVFIPHTLDEPGKQFAEQEQNRKILKGNWEKLNARRNSLNKISEEIEKLKKIDNSQFTNAERMKIELMLIEFDHVLTKQQEVLTKRESILAEEDRLITEMESLLNA